MFKVEILRLEFVIEIRFLLAKNTLVLFFCGKLTLCPAHETTLDWLYRGTSIRG